MGSITELQSSQLPKIDLLFGGSPCQSFSNAGNGTGFDGKSGLFYDFVRLLKECKPTYFLLENVKMKKEWQDIISEESLNAVQLAKREKIVKSLKKNYKYFKNKFFA
jgi:site-specific DNA-cytosine methylase